MESVPPVESPTPPLAPPTVPGPIPRRRGRPYNTLAVASLICGIAGIVLPIVDIVAIVLGALGLRAIKRRPEEEQGSACAIIGIVTGAVGIALSALLALAIVSSVQSISTVKASIQGTNLHELHTQRQSMGYRDHVARAIIDDSYPVHMYVVEGGFAGKVRPGLALVGDYDMAQHDGTPRSLQRLEVALDRLDTSAPWYRFGQCWFVRLDAPRYDAELVAAWSLHFSGEVRIVRDDGLEMPIANEDEWALHWEVDAKRRATLGLPEMPAPPFPTIDQLQPETDEAASPP